MKGNVSPDAGEVQIWSRVLYLSTVSDFRCTDRENSKPREGRNTYSWNWQPQPVIFNALPSLGTLVCNISLNALASYIVNNIL